MKARLALLIVPFINGRACNSVARYSANGITKNVPWNIYFPLLPFSKTYRLF